MANTRNGRSEAMHGGTIGTHRTAWPSAMTMMIVTLAQHKGIATVKHIISNEVWIMNTFVNGQRRCAYVNITRLTGIRIARETCWQRQRTRWEGAEVP